MSKNLKRAYRALDTMDEIGYANLEWLAYSEFKEQYNELLTIVEELAEKAKRRKKKKSAPAVKLPRPLLSTLGDSYADVESLVEKAWPGRSDEWLNTYNHFLGMTPSTAYILEGPGRVIEALSHDINSGNYPYPKGTK